MSEKISLFLFAFSAIVAVFLYGVSVGNYELFPFQHLRDAKTTLEAIISGTEISDDYYGEFLEFSETPAANANAARIRSFPGAPNSEENFLIFGGLNQYLDLCPKHGCLAVEVTPGGDVVHAYPYLPQEIYAANSTPDYPYEYIEFDPLLDARPHGIERFSDGDLLVTFQGSRHAIMSPYGTGVARIDREGKPRWFRFDYTHHWPSPIRGDELLVPAMSIGDAPIAIEWPDGTSHTLECGSNKPYRSLVRILDGAGKIVREISVLEAVLKSPYAAILQQTTHGCDPVHLNFIDVVREDVPAGLKGIAPGDLVVSLRNISAFGIIDPESGRLKRLVRGTFLEQHSVQHLAGSRFLIFDNLGGDEAGGPSRLLEVDLATGSERTVFPVAAQGSHRYHIFSPKAGHLSISPDRTRVLVNSSYQGTAFEVRLGDGEVLREFRNLHDVSRVDGFAPDRHEKAAVFWLFGVNYVPR